MHLTLTLACVGMALGAALPAAQAAIAPHTISMTSTSRSCIVNCTTWANYASDSDAASTAFGAYTDLEVSTLIDGTAANSFPVSGTGSTTITGTDTLTVHLGVTSNPLTNLTGSYVSQAGMNFIFRTDASGGTMNVDYLVSYVRPIDGATLNTGISFSAPFGEMLFGGRSVLPISFDSLSGTVSGSWQYTLLPDTLYSVMLEANNTTAFSAPSAFGADMLDATYRVTLPAFAQPVPEPAGWMLWLTGLVAAGRTARRRLSTN